MEILLQEEPMTLDAGETLLRIGELFQVRLPEDVHKLTLGEFVNLVERLCPALPARTHSLAR
jgi:hypothetical protein